MQVTPVCARASAASFINTDRPINFDHFGSGICFAPDTAVVVCTRVVRKVKNVLSYKDIY